MPLCDEVTNKFYLSLCGIFINLITLHVLYSKTPASYVCASACPLACCHSTLNHRIPLTISRPHTNYNFGAAQLMG
jgi:hypothetical protein